MDVEGEGGSRASPAPGSTRIRTTRCYKSSLDRPASGDEPKSAARREHRDAALTEGWDWGWPRSCLGWDLVSPARECHLWKDIPRAVGLEMEQALV